MRRAPLLLLLVLAGCLRRSPVPWSAFEIELEAGAEVTIRASGHMTFGAAEFETTVRGPAKLSAQRDGTILVDRPGEPAVPAVPAEVP